MPRTPESRRLLRDAATKNIYVGVYAMLAGLAITGLGMVLAYRMGAVPQVRSSFKSVHEVLSILLAIFIPLHVCDVVFVQKTDEAAPH